MALHKRKPVKTEPSDFDKLMTEFNKNMAEQTKQLADLNRRMDTLIEADKKVHEKVDKSKPEDTKPEDTKPEDGDGSDKKYEHEEKIENA